MSSSQETFRSAYPPDPYPAISYGLPYPEACAKHINQTFKCHRVYILCSGTISRTGAYLQDLIDALGSGNVVGIRRGMTPHSLWSEILEVANEARNSEADCIVTLGAGSLTDAAKIVVLALVNHVSTGEELSKISAKFATSELKPATIPIICIPTSLSGGEYSSIAGGTEDQSREKHLFKHNSLMPSLVILSPQLAQTTPQITWLSSGVRSVDHCIETLGSLYSNPAADSVAASSLTALVPALLACKTEPQNEENFLTAQLAVIDAMSAVQKGVRLGGSHAIGHQLGPLGVGHGITSCIMLPAVMAYNAKHGSSNPEILERQKNATEIIWSQPKCREVLTNSGLSQDTAMLADILDMIIRELGMPRTLRDVSVTEEKFDILAANSLKDSLAKFNPVPLKEKDQILEILGMVEGYKGNKS